MKCKIVDHIGRVCGRSRPMDLNIVQWGKRKPVYDLRRWRDGSDGTFVPGKGITLSRDELRALRDILNDMEVLDDEEAQ